MGRGVLPGHFRAPHSRGRAGECPQPPCRLPIAALVAAGRAGLVVEGETPPSMNGGAVPDHPAGQSLSP